MKKAIKWPTIQRQARAAKKCGIWPTSSQMDWLTSAGQLECRRNGGRFSR